LKTVSFLGEVTSISASIAEKLPATLHGSGMMSSSLLITGGFKFAGIITLTTF
jgi:hypothetical protein